MLKKKKLIYLLFLAFLLFLVNLYLYFFGVDVVVVFGIILLIDAYLFTFFLRRLLLDARARDDETHERQLISQHNGVIATHIETQLSHHP